MTTDVTPGPAPGAAPEAPQTVSGTSRRGNAFALGAMLCSVAVLLLAGPIAVVAWLLMIATVVLVVLARRSDATHRWMTVTAIVLLIVGALVSLVMPTIVVTFGLLLFGGEVHLGDVVAMYWHYWSGQYLFAAE